MEKTVVRIIIGMNSIGKMKKGNKTQLWIKIFFSSRNSDHYT